jgi:anti-sigma factor RsiW
MKHLTSKQLSAFLDGGLPPAKNAEGQLHLERCEECRKALAALETQDRSLRAALDHDPGDQHFERLAARIGERVARAAGGGRPASTAASPAGQPGSFGAWFARPGNLAWVGGVAAIVVGVGIGLVTLRDTERWPFERPDAARGRRGAPLATVRPPAAPAGDSARRAQAPGPSATSEEAAAQGAPATGPPAENAPSPGAEAGRASGSVEQAKPEAASRERAQEVRRNAQGEEVPVKRPGLPFAAPPPAATPAPAAGAGGAARLPRPREVQPLRETAPQAEPSAPAASGEKAGAAPSSEAKLEAPATGKAQEPAPSPAPAAEPRALAPEPRAPAPAGTAAADRATAATTRICGEVRDGAGRAIPSASVTLVTAGRGASTDAGGRFCIDAPPGEHTLTVMAIGFTPVTQTVRAGEDSPPIAVTLEAVQVLGGPGGSRLPIGAGLARGTQGLRVPEPAPGAFAVLPESLRALARNAQRLSASAAEGRSASRWDAAAWEWERLLPRVAGGPFESEVRFRVAEARFLAWQIGPGERRARAATEALTAYLVRAPAGERRNRAATWLDRVRR